MKESSSSRTLSSLFLILSLNDFFGSFKNGNDFISAYCFAGHLRMTCFMVSVEKREKKKN